MRRVVAHLTVIVAAGACSQPGVALRYQFPEGRDLNYRWRILAETTSEAAGEQVTHRLSMALDVREEVLARTKGGGGRLRMVLEPRSVEEDGVQSRPGPPLELELEVGPTGRVEKVLQAADLPPEAVTALELERLLSESRPPLPGKSVRLDEPWAVPLVSRGKVNKIDLKGQGRLVGFGLSGGRKIARLKIDRRGTVTSEQPTGWLGPNGSSGGGGRVLLEGTSSVRSTASLDLDAGLLVSARSRARSTFDVTLDQAKEAGKLRVVLDTRVDLVS
ncbi:MAG: hypothetical protein ACRDIF_07120 [Actinomycetota bacterium]